MKTLFVRLTFTEGILGTCPNNEDIYRDYIIGKAKKAGADISAKDEVEEIEALPVDEQIEKGITVFPRNKDGKPFLYDYQIKGFFKDACGMLRNVPGTESSKLTAYKSKIDGLIFVGPREIVLDAEPGICQRPLRAETLQGPRVALAISEEIGAGVTCEFEITTMVEAAGKSKKKKIKTKDEDGNDIEITEEVTTSVDYVKLIREWLDYGKLRGIGQWRNSGKGRFTWEELEIM